MHFGFVLVSSDINLGNIDLLEFIFVRYSHPQKTFCFSTRRLQEVFKTCLQNVFKTCLQNILKAPSAEQFFVVQDVLKKSSRRLGRRKISTLKTCWRLLQDMSWRRLVDLLKTSQYSLVYNCLLKTAIFHSKQPVVK